MSGRAPERAQINVSNALIGTRTINLPKWNYNMFRKWMQTAAVGEKHNNYGQVGQFSFCFL